MGHGRSLAHERLRDCGGGWGKEFRLTRVGVEDVICEISRRVIGRRCPVWGFRHDKPRIAGARFTRERTHCPPLPRPRDIELN